MIVRATMQSLVVWIRFDCNFSCVNFWRVHGINNINLWHVQSFNSIIPFIAAHACTRCLVPEDKMQYLKSFFFLSLTSMWKDIFCWKCTVIEVTCYMPETFSACRRVRTLLRPENLRARSVKKALWIRWQSLMNPGYSDSSELCLYWFYKVYV